MKKDPRECVVRCSGVDHQLNSNMHSTLSFHPLRLLSIPLLLFNIRGVIEETETEASVGRCPSANPNNHIAGQETWDDGVPDALGIHRFSLPDSYKADQQMPLLLYFHGWGEESQLTMLPEFCLTRF